MPLTEISNQVARATHGIQARNSSKKVNESVHKKNSSNFVVPSQPLLVVPTTANTEIETSSTPPPQDQQLSIESLKVQPSLYDWKCYLCKPLKGPLVHKAVSFIEQPQNEEQKHVECYLCQCTVPAASKFLLVHCGGKKHQQSYQLLEAYQSILKGNDKRPQQRVDKCLALQSRIALLTRAGHRNKMTSLLLQHLQTKDSNAEKHWEWIVIKTLLDMESEQLRQEEEKAIEETSNDICAEKLAAEAMLHLKESESIVSDDLQYSPFSQDDNDEIFFSAFALTMEDDKAFDDTVVVLGDEEKAAFLSDNDEDYEESQDDFPEEIEDWEDEWNLGLHLDESLLTIPEVEEAMNSFLTTTIDFESFCILEDERKLVTKHEEDVRTALAVVEALAFFGL